MDLVDLLVLLAFVGFPLLQLLLEKLGGGRKGQPPVEDEQEPTLPAPDPIPTHEPSLPAKAGEEWSTGWGSWPVENLEDLTTKEVVSESQADELIALQDRLASREMLPEALRVTVPVVSLEALTVDRKAEQARVRATASSRAIVAQRFAAPSISHSLRSQADLRRAIILADVLGKPRGMQ